MRYNCDLDRYCRDSYSIPYRLHVNSRYRNNCYYWSTYWSKWFKVIEAEYDFSFDPPKFIGATVQWSDCGMGYITSDLTTEDFRIELDNERIRCEEIINSNESYTGAEIEYWFFVNKIEEKDPILFQKFKRFITPGQSMLNPMKYYFLSMKEYKGNICKVKVIPDKSKVKFPKKEEY